MSSNVKFLDCLGLKGNSVLIYYRNSMLSILKESLGGRGRREREKEGEKLVYHQLKEA